MDLNWIAPTILAFAAFVGSVASAWVSIVGARRSAKAEEKASAAEEQSKETKHSVNSRMDEFKILFEEKFRLQGKIEEQDAQKEREIRSAIVPSPEQAINVAEEKAKKLIAEATVEAEQVITRATSTAAQLLAEAHRVSISNKPTEPIPVQVVQGAGVDEPMKVTNTPIKR